MAQSKVVVKKAKRKLQHKEAIAGYEQWLKKHPKATHKEKFDQFDMFVDSSLLVGEIDALQATAA
jgi:hypothetical protein